MNEKCIAIVGMRACGKSTLGRELAQDLEREFADTDTVFEERLGSIDLFVKKYGWAAFRIEEKKIARDLVRKNTVVSFGGGAIETQKVRELMIERSEVVWIQADFRTILHRMLLQEKGRERPSLTDLPLEEELHRKLTERNPLYEEVADIVVPAELKTSTQLQRIRSNLE